MSIMEATDNYRKPKPGARFACVGDEGCAEVWIIAGRSPNGISWELRRDVPNGDPSEHRFLYQTDDDLAAWRFIFPPCVDCGEADSGSCPGGRCRDCDMEYVMSAGACRECHTWLIRPEVAEMTIAEQHNAGCSLRDVEDCRPTDDAELAAVRKARYGWAPETKATA